MREGFVVGLAMASFAYRRAGNTAEEAEVDCATLASLTHVT